MNESGEQCLSPVSDEHKHQYVWLFVLKLKGNCCAKPLILLLLFNQARTTEMQMLMTAARDDLPLTYTLSLNNLRSPDETEHFCQIWSVSRGRIVGGGDLFQHITNRKIVIKIKIFWMPWLLKLMRHPGKPPITLNLKSAKSQRAGFTGRSDRTVDVS